MIAFYYAWFDMGDWQKGTTSTGDLPDPLYDGGDETALNRHLQQAVAAGIDALACAWKGPGDKTTTQRCKKLLDLAAARGGKVKVAMFADQADTGWFVGSEGAMVKAIELLKSDFMPSPAYLRVGDRPVVLAWLAHSLGGPDAWQRVRGQVDPENKQFWMAGTDQFQYLDSFDALFYFDISWESKPGAAMASYAGRLSRYNQSSGAGKPFVATVQAGYDDTLNRGPGHKVVPHTADAAYYKQTWQAAIDRRACATVLTSFNEFFEGSYIEPSAQFGKTYLDVTGQMTAQYKTAP